ALAPGCGVSRAGGSAQPWGVSPQRTGQSVSWSSSSSKIVRLVYGRGAIWVCPSEVAACAKFRFGPVSPGTEQNQREHTAISPARGASTGTFPGGWQATARGPRAFVADAACVDLA